MSATDGRPALEARRPPFFSGNAIDIERGLTIQVVTKSP
jgi:hypothetical protein